MTTVIVPDALPEGWLAALDGLATTTDRAALVDAEGILTLLTDAVDDALLDRAPRLKVVSNMAVGVDNIDVEACTRRGIPVGHTPGVLTDATADLTLALLLAAARRLAEAVEDARSGRWTTWSPTGWLGADLRGATLGIVGPGKIGRAVEQRARGFGMTVLSAGRDPAALDHVLRHADFVSLHVPLTPQTRGLIDAAALRRMKPSAILINTSRGQVVDQDALVAALRAGEIAAAALDVTVPEPLPADHPLHKLALVTPHIGSATTGTRHKMADVAARNLLAGLRGDPLPHCANPRVYA